MDHRYDSQFYDLILYCAKYPLELIVAMSYNVRLFNFLQSIESEGMIILCEQISLGIQMYLILHICNILALANAT